MDNEIKQYNFTGASGTGKSTILNMLRAFLPDEYEFKTEVVRDLIKSQGISINKDGNKKGQELVFQAYLNHLMLNYDRPYVSDRCVIDPLCYTMIGVNEGKIPREVLDYQWDIVKTVVKNGYLKKIYYFPIEFPVVADGVRSTDEEYRKEQDAAIKGVLDDLVRMFPDKFSYETVHGTPLERVGTILGKDINNI